MIEREIDIVGDVQANTLSQHVSGHLRIDLGDEAKEQAIYQIFRQAELDAYRAMTGLDPTHAVQPGWRP